MSLLRLLSMLALVSIDAPRIVDRWRGERGAAAVARSHPTGDCAAPWQLTVTPQRPRPGTLFIVRLTSRDGGDVPQAFIAGERLHFTRDSAGRWEALAAAPIDSAQSLGVIFVCSSGATDSAQRSLPLSSASYPLEKLRVAPQFSAPPDSALERRMQRESERATAVSIAARDTPRLFTAPFRAPRDSRVTSPFGRGREFNGSVTSRHMGTDYAGAVGAPIRAANRGVVRIVDRFFLGGNVVYLDHGEGIVTAYLHLSQHRVAEGDTVARGAVIGLVGATGRVTGPHLHWIARFGRVSVDPLSLIRATAAPPSAESNGRATPSASARALRGAAPKKSPHGAFSG